MIDRILGRLAAVALGGAVLAAPAIPCAQEDCPCAPRTPAAIFASGDTVLDGLVVEVRVTEPGEVEAFLAVDEVYAGRADPIVRVRTPAGACGLAFRPGERWVVVATRESGVLTSDRCSGSSTDDALVRSREPVDAPLARPPRAVPEPRSDDSGATVAVAAALAVLAATAHGLTVWRTRARR